MRAPMASIWAEPSNELVAVLVGELVGVRPTATVRELEHSGGAIRVYREVDFSRDP